MDDLSQTQMDELLCALQKQKEELQLLLEQMEQSSEPVGLDQQAFGRVSRMGAMQQQSMVKASRKSSEHVLRLVILALGRMESGDYGSCLDCENHIGYQRLQARPETPRCVNCQSKREQV